MKNVLPALIITAAVASCSSARPDIPMSVPEPEPAPVSVDGGRSTYMPRARAYRTNGHYADNVPVRLNADGTLLSFPAPTDITAASAPIPLADGWLLDRMGVSLNSVFTRYTLEQYAALPQAPSPAQLIESIIPQSKVTELVELPFTTAEAIADTAACTRYLLAR